jgi:cell division transport system permease protein
MDRKERKRMRRRLINAYASSIISISLVLMLVGLSSLFIVNAKRMADYFKENMQVVVMMREEVSEPQAEEFCAGTEMLPFVRSARVVTREEGETELKKMLGEDFLDVFESSPVPLSLDINLYADYVNPDSLEMVRTELGSSPLVEDVECRQPLVEMLNRSLGKLSLLLLVLVALLLFISYVLIGNTVRLNVFARRFTVHTMKLVGATRAFIRRPFIGAGVMQGLIAGVIAFGGIALVLALLRRSFASLVDVVVGDSLPVVAAIVVVAGIFICVTSTWFVVNRLISLNKDDLYY